MNNGVHFRPTRAEISRQALENNARVARQLAADARLIGVVKADGYGHGMLTVANAIAPYVDAFAVAFVDEAVQLRNAGFQQPVILLEGCFSEAELPICAHYNFQPVAHQQEQLNAITTARLVRPLAVWLKVDTGMHRLGWAPEQVAEAYQQLKRCPQVASVTMMSHFAAADSHNHKLNQQQLELFEDACAVTEANLDLSVANSAALVSTAIDLAHPSQQWVRSGILIYGDNPSSSQLPAPLQSVMRLVAAVIAIRDIKAGDTVSYGGTWEAKRDSTIATVSIGYADGYPRHAKNGTPVFINGHKAHLAGTVTMDMIMVDITDVPEVNIGDEVELWGANVSVAEIAQCADTISYDLLTGVSARVPRVPVS
ncbi:alanine racemase [Pseudidiomarina donghaiensis]|uniref:alanine racemase n=1 Tax=Pseudidiomarina donghaiensis TaxID=519452 RepID=UPI003A96A580